MYKILEMFKLDKLSNITRRFLLEDSQLHIFSLEVEKCPLDICLLTVKYKMNANSRRVKKPIVLPVTLHNFIEFLPVAKEEWLGMWN